VARLRRLESQLTAVAIVQVLRKETPPIVVSVRTVEGDFVAVRADTHRYLTTKNVDARFEVGEALAPHEPIARKATQRALTVNGGDGAKWARIAIRATEARTQLLQDIGLIDREIGTLFIDDGQRADRISSGTELQKLFNSVTVTDAELISEAELAWQHGDAAAAREAKDSPEGLVSNGRDENHSKHPDFIVERW
jgi:hypothetical protein